MPGVEPCPCSHLLDFRPSTPNHAISTPHQELVASHKATPPPISTPQQPSASQYNGRPREFCRLSLPTKLDVLRLRGPRTIPIRIAEPKQLSRKCSALNDQRSKSSNGSIQYDTTAGDSRYPSPGHEEGESADPSEQQKPAAKRKRENRYKNAPPAVLSVCSNPSMTHSRKTAS